MTKVLLATRNAKKLTELQRILDAALGAQRVQLVGLADVAQYQEVPETGLTFGENALLKAREGVKWTACRRSPTTPGWSSTR
jgi:XTP/dITP diphosphohydrolase